MKIMEEVEVVDEEKEEASSVEPQHVERLVKNIPNPLPMIIENVVILVAALFLPLFNMFYDIPLNSSQTITIKLPLSGRVLGLYPWLIALAALINVGITLNEFMIRKKLLKNEEYFKIPKKVLDHVTSMRDKMVFFEIFVSFIVVLLALFYYSYLVNYDQTLPSNPIDLLPSQVWMQLGFTQEPTSYFWNLRLEYGTYILITAVAITLIHSLIIFFKLGAIKNQLSNLIPAKKVPITTTPEKKEEIVEKRPDLIYDEYDLFEEEEEAMEEEEAPPAPVPPTTEPQVPIVTTPSITTTQAPTVSTRFPQAFTPPQLRPCYNCHTQIPVSAKFCYECGSPAAAS